MDHELLEQYLANRDELCPACGYNLRGLTGTHCPECGDELRLHVGLVEPKKAAFFTGLIGLSAGGGFSGLLMVYAICFIIFRGGGGGPGFGDIFLLMGETTVAGLFIALWIRSARRIRRLSTVAQWWLALLCCLLAPVNLIIFAAVVQ